MTTSPKVSPLRFELVDVVKRLQADCDEVRRLEYGRLSQHERQEEQWTKFTDAWSGKDYQQAADSLVQFLEAAGHQMLPAEQDKLPKSIKAAKSIGDLGESAVTAYKEYVAFEEREPDVKQGDLYLGHLLWDALRLIQERTTGISFEDLVIFSDRLLSIQGIGPVSYARRPDGVQPEPWPDTSHITGQFKELDRDGTTELLLHKLRELSPDVMERVGLFSARQSDPIEDVDLEELERTTPPCSRGDGQWVTGQKAAEIEGLVTDTLKSYRHRGVMNSEKTFGRDRDGRIWRRDGTPRSHPKYLRRTLREASLNR